MGTLVDHAEDRPYPAEVEMLHLLKIVSLAVAAAWSLVRGAEEGLALWVRRAARTRDLSGLSWA